MWHPNLNCFTRGFNLGKTEQAIWFQGIVKCQKNKQNNLITLIRPSKLKSVANDNSYSTE